MYYVQASTQCSPYLCRSCSSYIIACLIPQHYLNVFLSNWYQSLSPSLPIQILSFPIIPLRNLFRQAHVLVLCPSGMTTILDSSRAKSPFLSSLTTRTKKFFRNTRIIKRHGNSSWISTTIHGSQLYAFLGLILGESVRSYFRRRWMRHKSNYSISVAGTQWQ